MLRSLIGSLLVLLLSLHSSQSLEKSAMSTKSVIVAIAMEDEAKPFIDHLKLEKVDGFFPSNTPFLAYSGTHENCKVTVVTNGKDSVYGTGVDNVGTVPASLATYLALQKEPNTDVVVNAGTCGGFKRQGAVVGDVFVVTSSVNHDRRIPIPVFTPYGVGKLDKDEFYRQKLVDDHGFKTGVCTTGNSLDATEVDHEHMKNHEASVKDMEAAAIAWSCALFKTPMVGLKVVTDIVDGEMATQDEFLANLAAASKSLQESLPKVLDTICNSEAPSKDEL